MKRILIVGLTNGIGGVETYLCNLNNYINNKNFKIDFLVHQDIQEIYRRQILKKKSEIHKITGIKDNPIRYFKELFKFYEENTYDLIYLNECTSEYFIYCLPVLFNRKVKLVVHSHNGSGRNKFLHKLLGNIQNKRADDKWACSEIAYKWMFEKENKEKIIIHNGIDLDRYKYSEEKRKKMRKELNIDDNTFVIGSIARFELQKNHNKIIEIYKEYLSINSQSILILVGEGSLKDIIRKKVKEMGLTNNVLFLGARDNISEILMAFDLFLLPSLYEGLPFVTIESQATGLPMLVSNGVSTEINLTDLIYREDLKSSNNIWANQINKIKNNNCNLRTDEKYIYQLRKSGYDIKNVAKGIEERFYSLINNNGGKK